jgi:hypothetical protein
MTAVPATGTKTTLIQQALQSMLGIIGHDDSANFKSLLDLVGKMNDSNQA